MVGVKFDGRLGNQLFQYVFYKYLQANVKGYSYFFSNTRNQVIGKYFDFGFKDNFALRSRIYASFIRKLLRNKKFEDVHIYNIFYPKKPKVTDNTIINGFYQAHWYLDQLPDGLSITIRKKYTDHFNALYGDLFKQNKTIALHIRRTDYINFGKRDIRVPITFFKEQLNLITDLDSYTVFFLSDDIEYVKQEFELRPNFIFSNNNEITDFQIIQNADLAIISNSTFSWWAAYLGKPGNKVIAPENWLGFTVGSEYPRGIMTDKFIWVKVNR